MKALINVRLLLDAINFSKSPGGRHDALALLELIYVSNLLQAANIQPRGQKTTAVLWFCTTFC